MLEGNVWPRCLLRLTQSLQPKRSLLVRRQYRTLLVAYLKGLDGALYTSPDPVTGSSGTKTVPIDLGRRQGDYMVWRDSWLANSRWNWGTPPSGDFVPTGVAGTNYSSPGYK